MNAKNILRLPRSRHLAALAAALVATAYAATVAGRGGETAGADSTSDRLETATFSMYCYWTGEATLGQVPGVVASRIGHLDGNEIVEVTYDPTATDLGELVTALKDRNSFYSLIVPGAERRSAAEPYVASSEIAVARGRPHFVASKHSLQVRYPHLYYLDLSERQAIALNTWSHFGGAMPDVLSAEQRSRTERLREKLRHSKPPVPDPSSARSGEDLAAYRQTLLAWLAE